ncbi:D-alanine--D-alanine ligase [Tenacibaculum sp. M341]|uniref:D-alanine--D-alanine ligase n=1 Tax=Tenacibaculum sp. M341 TaxID=2530339 RepID=UPI001050FCCF|nr:D-alanine--D-alanine ligase [Tenacibaculum sp. M341]TCI85666.1 D-alanine--D-alanine ligase [Tenacibaculum sp. M341]
MIKKINITKLTNWEYWPSSMFYLPNLPYAFYLAIRAKHPAFFSVANPAIKSSGNGTESKFDTIQLVPEKFRPKSILIKPKTDFSIIKKKIEKSNIEYPLIAKPDIGFRGLLVKKINSEVDLKKYFDSYPIDIIIQEFLDYENECGVFYHRNPKSNKGVITSITLKKFISVIGDGKSSLQELIHQDNRAKIYFDLFKEIHKENLDSIPSENEVIKLTVIGNHSKGTQFINGNHLISKKLENTFDQLSKSIDGWYYGRVDLKYNSFKELEEGIDFKVLEINGIIAEPTHIYDSENFTYFKALKAIRNHWKYLFNISITNHEIKKIPYKSPLQFINEVLQLKKYIISIKKLI